MRRERSDATIERWWSAAVDGEFIRSLLEDRHSLTTSIGRNGENLTVNHNGAMLLTFLAACLQQPQIEAVTFAERPRMVYLPAREAAKALGWTTVYDPVLELLTIKNWTLDPFAPRLSDGTWLIDVTQLKALGAEVNGSTASHSGRRLRWIVPPKRTEVNLTTQQLFAYQGKRLVYLWPVSSGRDGKPTPTGKFKAGFKKPMHISTIYGSPMPFSIHVTGNIFIHGSTQVGETPGSHGCIRLQVQERRNTAEEFYTWIDVGTPIKIYGRFDFKKISQ